MIGAVTIGPLHEQFGNPASRMPEAPGIAFADNFFESGDQRGCDGHEYTRPGAKRDASAI
jgi:hypothetical protein